jgi:hypothetical protein
MCPCHGGVYYENGDHASGPPPRALYQYAYRIKDGNLEALVGHMPTLQDLPDEPLKEGASRGRKPLEKNQVGYDEHERDHHGTEDEHGRLPRG